jgi:hypothetical protein
METPSETTGSHPGQNYIVRYMPIEWIEDQIDHNHPTCVPASGVKGEVIRAFFWAMRMWPETKHG